MQKSQQFPDSPKRKLNVLRQAAFDLTAITTSEPFKPKFQE